MTFPSQPPPLAGIVHTDVRVDGCRWHVATAGPADAPPIVLVHGWPQHWWAWRKVIPALAKEHRVYAPDLRGFGWSDAPSADYSKGALADDLLLLLDVLELDRCTLVGHDWGGLTSWLAALKAPERFDRLVVMSINNPWELPPPTPKLLALAASYQVPVMQPLARTFVQPQVVRGVLRAGVGGEHRWSAEDVRLYADQYKRSAHAAAASSIYRSFLTRELPKIRRGRYASRDSLDIPVAVVAGGADQFTGGHTAFRGLEAHVPDLTTHVIDGANHFVPEEKPREVIDIILGR
jgi:pimeloyl-ACP methyl ester carboxylesterase